MDDLEYLGHHNEFEGILDSFVKGDLVRATKEPREIYMGQRVIDMSKIRMDFARNDVNAGTLRILDREFFASLSTKKENKNEEACDENNFGEMGQKLTSGINQMLKNTTPVKADQLGFGFGGDTSSEGEEEIKE